MKAKITRFAKATTFFATMLLATCLFAGSASAQTGFQAKFTLPFEAHWGHAVLPAGDYSLTPAYNMPNTLIIRNAKTDRAVALVVPYFRDESRGGKSALLIVTRGTQHVVYALRIADFDQILVYVPALANAAAVEEAHRTQAVPVIVAQN